MKKVLTSILSFALILVMGFAVGCADNNKISYKVTLRDNVTGLKIERKGDNYVFTCESEEANTALSAGVALVVTAKSSKSDSYTITTTGVSGSSTTGRTLEITYKGEDVTVNIVDNTEDSTGESLESVTFTIKSVRYTASSGNS